MPPSVCVHALWQWRDFIITGVEVWCDHPDLSPPTQRNVSSDSRFCSPFFVILAVIGVLLLLRILVYGLWIIGVTRTFSLMAAYVGYEYFIALG